MYTDQTKVMARHTVLGLLILGLNACHPSDLNTTCAQGQIESCEPQERDPRLYRVQDPDTETSRQISERSHDELREHDPCTDEVG